jgi:hypothetical protein
MPTDAIVCLTCGKHIAECRGCCSTCYRRHCLAVRAGQTTWVALEAAGKALPSVARPRLGGGGRCAPRGHFARAIIFL